MFYHVNPHLPLAKDFTLVNDMIIGILFIEVKRVLDMIGRDKFC